MALNIKRTNEKNKADQIIQEKTASSIKDDATKDTLESLEKTYDSPDESIPEKISNITDSYNPINKTENQQITEQTIEILEKRPKTGKIGRPKLYDKPKTKFCAYIDKELHDEIEEYSSLFKGGKSAYLEKLIKQDLESNRQKYKDMINMLN